MITVIGDAIPAAPETFLRRMRQLDPSLHLSWNGRKHKWLIEQCIEHHAAGALHDHTCRRVYVYLVQAENGDPMPLSERVLDKLKEIDTQRQGYGPDRLEAWRRDRMNEQLELEARRNEEMRDAIRHSSRYNRRQLLRAVTLMGRHDLRVNQ